MIESGKIESIIRRMEEIERRLAEPSVIADPSLLKELSVERSELLPLAQAALKWQSLRQDKDDALSLIKEEKDPEMLSLLYDEISQASEGCEKLEREIELLLIPRDPDDDKNIIMEIRAGTGGDEAALFAGDLFSMYQRYCTRQGWEIEIFDFNEGEKGGYKEIKFNVRGRGAYQRLKFEGGGHRVQRVPVTGAKDKLQTSAATVAVMPEADEVDVRIDDKDLEWDYFRASGAGGQHINKTSSAVRVKHIPSGLVVAMQEERSQHQNKEKALRLLRSRLYQAESEARQGAETDLRRSQVGSGDRSEKTRTYNYPQDRVTDERTKPARYKLETVMSGNMDELIEDLMRQEELRRLGSERLK